MTKDPKNEELFTEAEFRGAQAGKPKALRRKSFFIKMFQVSFSTLISRVLGLTREILQAYFLGANALSDTFLLAYTLPNSLRKVFAEGALSASFIPSFVKTYHKKGISEANKLLTLTFIMFEGAVLLVCYLVMWYAKGVLHFAAPGWSGEKIIATIPYLRILMPFIFFISSSALIAGPLNAANHFFIPAFGPVILNIVYIGALLLCLYFGLPIEFLCFAILFGGLALFLSHLIAYLKCDFSFEMFDRQSLRTFGFIMLRFFPCFFAMSIIEVNFLIDKNFMSYLPDGTMSLYHYASGFMRIPLGVFAVAFATIIFPMFSRVSIYAPKRLGYFLFESFKFLFWIIVPFTFYMAFFAKDIFVTLFSAKFAHSQVVEAGGILIALLVGLFFFSINKVILNAYYSLHRMWMPALVSLAGTLLNIILNFILMYFFKAIGLALATSLSTGVFQSIALVYLLKRQLKLRLYGYSFISFLLKWLLQFTSVTLIFLIFHRGMVYFIKNYAGSWTEFFLYKFGLWLWVGPLFLVMALVYILTRKVFGIKIHFLG